MRLLPHSVDVPWRHSLYGRIALGYVPLLAIMLAAQAAMFLSLVGDSATAPPGLTRVLAADLASRLAVDPNLDLDAFVRGAHPTEHVFVVMRDGRTAGERLPTANTIRLAQDDLRASPAHVPGTWEAGILRTVGVIVNGRLVGVLGIKPPTALERFGAPLAIAGVILLTLGTAISSVAIFGPVHRRIQELRATAQRFGAGELTARAEAGGRDEITQLARGFNAMADELAVREAQVTRSNRARQQLLADVSHELMTPLAAVLGYLETLTMPEITLDEERRRRMATVARREAQRLERLVGDVLEMARLEEGGNADFDAQLMPVRALFDQVLLHHEDTCRERRIRLAATVEAGAELVFGDPFRLDQALRNLVGNAFRHTPDGGAITLVAAPADEGIALTVTDTGEGIAADDLPLIFDRFYKARGSHRVAAPQSGSGLGLSIVKAIVLRHGGQVGASSVPGQGTTVRLMLPRALDESHADARIPA